MNGLKITNIRDNLARQVLRIGIESAADLAKKGLYSLTVQDEGKAIENLPFDKDKYNGIHKHTGIWGELIEGDVTLNYNDGRQLYIPNCTMSLSRSKRIVQTAINGQIGTVKEWISDGDIIVNMQVILLDKDDSFPLNNILSLRGWLERNELVEITNKILNNLGVTRVVVSSWSYSPETWNNVQRIDINLMQDDTYLIEEKIMR